MQNRYEYLSDEEASTKMIIDKYYDYLIKYPAEIKEHTFHLYNQNPSVRFLTLLSQATILIDNRLMGGKFE